MDQQQTSQEYIQQPLMQQQGMGMLEVNNQQMPGPNFQQQNAYQYPVQQQQPVYQQPNMQQQPPVMYNQFDQQQQIAFQLQMQPIIQPPQLQYQAPDNVFQKLANWQGVYIVPKNTLDPNHIPKYHKLMIYEADNKGNKVSDVSFIKISVPRVKVQTDCCCCNETVSRQCCECPQTSFCLLCNLCCLALSCNDTFRRLALYDGYSYNQVGPGQYKKTPSFQVDVGRITGCFCKDNQVSYLRPYGSLSDQMGMIEKHNELCGMCSPQTYSIQTGNSMQKSEAFKLVQQSCTCGDIIFDLINSKNEAKEGVFKKTYNITDWRCDCAGIKLFTRKKPCYQIVFPPNMTPQDKLLLLSATLQIQIIII